MKEHGNKEEKKDDLEQWLHNSQFLFRVHSDSMSHGPHRTLRGLSLASQTSMRGLENGLSLKKKLWANF